MDTDAGPRRGGAAPAAPHAPQDRCEAETVLVDRPQLNHIAGVGIPFALHEAGKLF
jgi:hypothetical protein